MMRRTMLAVMLALLGGCSDQEASNPARPEAYAIRLPVSPAPGGALQRLSVPAEALAALRSPARADLRIFDATGAALPVAVTAPPGGGAVIRSMTLDALPILGSGNGLTGGDATLSIEESADGRVVRLTRSTQAGADARVLGVLLDTRAIADPVRSLRLDARWPAQQPVSFAVETSEDLRRWTPLASRILYRKSADAAGAIGDEGIDLGDADLRRRYLRISWTSPIKLLGPVDVKRATLTVAQRVGDDRLAIETMPPRLIEAHDLRLDFDHPVTPTAMRIASLGGEMLVRVAISGRNGPEQGWTPLGQAVLRGIERSHIALEGAAFADYRIEADRRTAGFAKPPRVELLFEPSQLVTLLSGKPPYVLAAGAAQAEDRYLAIADLIPDYRRGAETALPLAMARGSVAPRLSLAGDDGTTVSRRKALLWGLLLLGVAVLAAMVWLLWKPGKPTA